MTQTPQTPHVDDAPRTADAPRTGDGLRGRTLLLAIDASPAAAAAARVARALADERGALPHVVHALDTSPVAVPYPIPALLAAADALIGPGVHAPDLQMVRDRLASTLGGDVDWPVRVAVGTPASVIARHAVQMQAALVVMGMRRHGRVDRMLHDETTLSVMRAAPCPVLGVTPAMTALPRGVVVGMDLDASSMRAARVACDLIAAGGRLVLAYVEGPAADVDATANDAADRMVRALGVDAALARAESELAPPAGVTVERHRVEGSTGRSVAEALRRTADACGAELIGVGRRRRALLDRLLMGSVPADLARDGSRSLLVVPPPG